MRTKLTLGGGKCSAKVWNDARQRLTPAEVEEIDWPSAQLGVVVRVVGVYFQAQSFGPMLEVESLLVKAEDASCPFGDAAPVSPDV